MNPGTAPQVDHEKPDGAEREAWEKLGTDAKWFRAVGILSGNESAALPLLLLCRRELDTGFASVILYTIPAVMTGA
jgi:8-oxo-dGTP pyrophosphatase MutT (NUDIX family)